MFVIVNHFLSKMVIIRTFS